MIPGIKVDSTYMSFAVPIPPGLNPSSAALDKSTVEVVDLVNGSGYTNVPVDAVAISRKEKAHCIVQLKLGANSIPASHMVRFSGTAIPTVTLS